MSKNASSWNVMSLVPIALFVGAFLTNPSKGDFEYYLENELGVLSLSEYQQHNYYVFSLYEINSLSFRRGEDRRVVLGLFGQFVEIKQKSSW
jgi:hypothetical protein